MRNFFPGWKTITTMSLALGVALWQYFVGPIPAIDSLPGGQETWNIAVPAVAFLLRFVTHKPVFGGK